MHPNDDFLSASEELDYDGFRAALREDWGWFTPACEANIFAGKVRTRRVFGFVAVDLACDAGRVERSNWTFAVMTWSITCVIAQATGGSTIIQTTEL